MNPFKQLLRRRKTDHASDAIPANAQVTRALPDLAIASHLKMKPGDMLAVMLPGVLSEKDRATWLAYLDAAVPPGVRCLVLEGGAQLAVVTPPPDAE